MSCGGSPIAVYTALSAGINKTVDPRGPDISDLGPDVWESKKACHVLNIYCLSESRGRRLKPGGTRDPDRIPTSRVAGAAPRPHSTHSDSLSRLGALSRPLDSGIRPAGAASHSLAPRYSMFTIRRLATPCNTRRLSAHVPPRLSSRQPRSPRHDLLPQTVTLMRSSRFSPLSALFLTQSCVSCMLFATHDPRRTARIFLVRTPAAPSPNSRAARGAETTRFYSAAAARGTC